MTDLTTLLPRLVALLTNIGEVIDTTDPESALYLDSGADTVQALCEHKTETRALLAALQTAPAPTMPKPLRVFIDLSGGVFQGSTADAPLDILIGDYDTGYGEDRDTLVDVPQDDGTTATASVVTSSIVKLDSAWLDSVWQAYDTRPMAAPVSIESAEAGAIGVSGFVPVDLLDAIDEAGSDQ